MKNLFSLLLSFIGIFLLLFAIFLNEGCNKKNSEPVVLPNRVISQLEYFRGTLNSTSTFNYSNNKIYLREYEFDKSNYKYEYEYSGNQVITYTLKKYGEDWGTVGSNVYSYNSNLLQEVLYREPSADDWNVYERWSFSYNGSNYNEILMEKVYDGYPLPDTKLDYSYNGDTLMGYSIYRFVAEWRLSRDVVFEYNNGLLYKTTLYYAPVNMVYGPQEQFTYEYSDGLNTRVVLSVMVDSAWVDRNEILREYNISNKMILETVKAIGDSNYEYQYKYVYELGEDNLELFPFFDQPLVEYIYPSLSKAMRNTLSTQAKIKSKY